MTGYQPQGKLIQVVEVQFNRGCGEPGDSMRPQFCAENHDHEPVRRVYRYYTLDGMLLAESDPIGMRAHPEAPTDG